MSKNVVFGQIGLNTYMSKKQTLLWIYFSKLTNNRNSCKIKICACLLCVCAVVSLVVSSCCQCVFFFNIYIYSNMYLCCAHRPSWPIWPFFFNIYMYRHMSIYMFIHICAFVCIYVYLYTYMYIYIYMSHRPPRLQQAC